MTRNLRILPFLLILCVLITALGGCDLIDSMRDSLTPSSDEDTKTYEVLEGMQFSTSPYYEPVTSRYAYAQLGERQQRLYDLLLEQVFTISPEQNTNIASYPMKAVRVSGQLSVAELRLTLRALSNDNPYLFWLSQTFSHVQDLDENHTKVIAYSEFSPETVRAMLARTDEALDRFYASVPAGLDAYEREKFVHDYVIDACDYNRSIARMPEIDEESIRGHSIYGALVDGSCVCEGYGMAMQLLLNGLGVDCVTLTGMSYDSAEMQDESDAVLHLWNAVCLDGQWYHVDPTWDDQEQELQRHAYFNLSDDVLFLDHTLSATPDQVGDDVIAEKGTEDLNLYIPTCWATEYNYFIYECDHLTDYDGEAVRDGLYRAAMNRESGYTFYIDPDYLDYDRAIQVLFRESPQYFFDYVDQINRMLYDYEIDNHNLTYYADAARSYVSVSLYYY